MYQTPFHITKPVGNNAFSYEKRTNKSLCIPSIIDGVFSDVRQGVETVFEDFDEKGILRSCTGLRNFVRTTYSPPWKRGIEGDWEIPMVIFDNHNHALYFWYEAFTKAIVSRGSTLVHIDEHSDLWENGNDIPFCISNPLNPPCQGETKNSSPDKGRLGGVIDLENIFHFTNYQCNVGNYIQPTLREGLIGKMLRIEDTIGMGKCGSYERGDWETLILNLDLDFFAPELDYIPFEDKKRIILHFARQAQLITVATSPFFIDQERAIAMLRRVFDFRI